MPADNLVIAALSENIKISVISGIVLAFSLYYLVDKIYDSSVDPREPPVIKPTIPFIGNTLGQMSRQLDYFLDL